MVIFFTLDVPKDARAVQNSNSPTSRGSPTRAAVKVIDLLTENV
jgi:hypothetical protein